MNKQITLLFLISITFAACSKKEDAKPTYTISQTAVSLNYDKQHQYTVKEGSNNVSPSTLTWTSSDETVGTISASGLFKAKKIGETTIKAEGSGHTVISDITVTPYSTLCIEPDFTFGSSKAIIKGKEKRVLSSEIENSLLYTGENSKLRHVMYVFENNQLSGSVLLMANSEAVMEEGLKFFLERYTFLGNSDNILIFSGVGVVIGVNYTTELGFHAMYIKQTSASTMSIQSIKKLYNQKIQSLGSTKLVN
jgi:hypothetical protein